MLKRLCSILLIALYDSSKITARLGKLNLDSSIEGLRISHALSYEITLLREVNSILLGLVVRYFSLERPQSSQVASPWIFARSYVRCRLLLLKLTTP